MRSVGSRGRARTVRRRWAAPWAAPRIAAWAAVGVLVGVAIAVAVAGRAGSDDGRAPPSREAAARAADPREGAARAARAHRLAVAARTAAARGEPELAFALATEALATDANPETTDAVTKELSARRPPPAAVPGVRAVAWAADGGSVLCATRDGEVHLLDRDGVERWRARGGDAGLTCGAFGPGGEVVVGGADGTARVFGPDGRARAVLRGASDEVVSVEPAADGAHVLVVSLDRRARVHGPRGEMLLELGAPEGVDVARFASRGRRVVAFARGGAVHVAPVDGAGAAARFTPDDGAVVDVVASPSGDGFAVRTDGAVVHRLDASGRAVAAWSGHTASVLDVAYAPAGDLLATASLDRTARCGPPDGGAAAVFAGHAAPVTCVRFAPDGARLVTVGVDRAARVWRRDGTPEATVGGAAAPVRSATFTADGAAVVVTWRGAAGLASYAPDGRALGRFAPTDAPALDVACSPDGARVAWVDADLDARVTVVSPAALLAAARAAGAREATDGERAAALAQDGGDAAPAAPAPAEPAAPRRGDHVGAARCAACHRAAYDLWRTSAHAATTALARDGSVPTLGPDGGRVAHPPGETSFRREGGGWVARTVGEDGAPRDFALTHTVGARRIRMLVATLADGRAQVLPSMCELPEGPWFDYTHLIFGAPGADPTVPPAVAPGDPSFFTGPVRSFDARCAGCHVSGREPRAPAADGTGPRSTWRALGVDCEACHGPGRAHAEAWERLETGAPLPRLETLDRTGEVEACTQCHLEGERLTPHGVVGEDLFEHVDPTLLLDPERVDPYGRPLELVYDGLPFGTSRCAEAGGLTCSRCHAPHGGVRRSLLRPEFEERAVCGGCHADVARDVGGHAHHRATGEGARCVACHMPFLAIERGHGRVADHTIGVPHPGLPGDRVAKDACTTCHAGDATGATGVPALDGEALRAAYARWWPRAAPSAWQHALAAARVGAPEALAGLRAVIDDARAPRFVRASAARLLGRSGDAARAALLAAARDADSLVRRAALTALAGFRGADVDARLRAALDDPSRAVRTAAARAALEGFERLGAAPALLAAVRPVLEADAAAVPDDDQRWFRLAAARELAGDVPGAIDAYARQVALDPFATNVRTHLARLRARASPPR